MEMVHGIAWADLYREVIVNLNCTASSYDSFKVTSFFEHPHRSAPSRSRNAAGLELLIDLPSA